MQKRNVILENAIKCLARGWLIIPLWGIRPDGHCECGPGCKKKQRGKHPRLPVDWKKIATADQKTIEMWWLKHPLSNYGILTGKRNDLVVLDLDGEAGREYIRGKSGTKTPIVKTGGGGTHNYFRWPGRSVSNSAGSISKGVDIRGDGGYVVGPGSRHASGKTYEWAPGLSPADIEPAPVPDWLQGDIDRKKSGPTKAVQGKKLVEGERNDMLFRLASSMRAKNFDESAIKKSLHEYNRSNVEPPLDSGEIDTIAESASKYPAGHKSMAEALIEGVELFHHGDACYGTVHIGSSTKTYLLRSELFARWLREKFFVSENKPLPQTVLDYAVQTAESFAQFRGEEKEVFVRVGHQNERVYLDLADASGSVVEVNASNWEVITDSGIKFNRPRGMHPLPAPQSGGALDELRLFINVSDQDWPLLVAWLVGTLMPKGPYPILVLHGEQGSAKTTTARILKTLLDPNKAPLRSEPRDARELMIACGNSWILALDNLSHLQPWLSDVMCRVSTGGGLSIRQLYTDKEEELFEAQRPILLNGIEELATRSDLLDRSMVLYLPTITGAARMAQAALWAGFEEARPMILGALLDAVSMALGRVAEIKLPELPRMADFARWVVAAEPALGLESGAFLAAYHENRAEANSVGLYASPFVKPFLEFVTGEKGQWEGIASDLLKEVENHLGYATDGFKRKRGWPNSANSVSNLLRRIAPNLRSEGIEIDFKRGRRRLITIQGVRNAASLASSSGGAIPVDAVDADDAKPQDGVDASDPESDDASGGE